MAVNSFSFGADRFARACRRAIVFILLLGLSVLPAESSRARTVGGITFPDQVVINGKTLQLVGMGDRIWMLIQVFVAAIYMERPLHRGPAVVNAEQTKYVLIQLDSRFLTFSGFKDTMDRGFRANHTPAQLKTLGPSIKIFFAMFRDRRLRRGDRIGLVYQPGQGLTVKYNGQALGTVKGAEFTKALYRVWVGKHPDSESLKRKLLGRD